MLIALPHKKILTMHSQKNPCSTQIKIPALSSKKNCCPISKKFLTYPHKICTPPPKKVLDLPHKNSCPTPKVILLLPKKIKWNLNIYFLMNLNWIAALSFL